MEQLAPLLEKWLSDNLLRLGVQTKGGKTPDPPGKTKLKGEKEGKKKTGNTVPPLSPPEIRAKAHLEQEKE